MKNFGQKGFTIVEGLLIFIVIAIIGGTGYYVYSQNKKNNSNEAYGTGVIQNKEPNQEVEEKSEKQYFEFTELGVKIPVNSNLDGLTYEKEEGAPFLFLSTDKLKTLIKSCGNLIDQTALSFTYMSLGKDTGKYENRTDQQVQLVRQFPDFHISAGYPHAPTWDPSCAKTDEIKNLIGTLQKETMAAFKEAELIQ